MALSSEVLAQAERGRQRNTATHASRICPDNRRAAFDNGKTKPLAPTASGSTLRLLDLDSRYLDQISITRPLTFNQPGELGGIQIIR